MAVGRLSCFSRSVETIRNRVECKQIVREPRLMKRVVTHELLPDMVLAKPVVNTNGLPIVAAGTILDVVMIERLRQMEGDALDSGGKTLAELEAELDHRFRQVVQDPIQQLILRTLRTHVRATHGMASVTKPSQAT